MTHPREGQAEPEVGHERSVGPGTLSALPLGQLLSWGQLVCVGGRSQRLHQDSDARPCLKKLLSLRSHGQNESLQKLNFLTWRY